MIKIICTDTEMKTATFDLYLEIPTGNNSAGIDYAAAIAMAGDLETETIETVDYVKRRETMRFSSTDLTNAQRLVELNASHESAKTRLNNYLSSRLAFTGYTIANQLPFILRR